MQGVRFEVEEFCEKVVTSADITLRADVSNITDRFFCHVERKHHLLNHYRRLQRKIGQGPLNQQIGRWIKVYFDLRNAGTHSEPASDLIASYTIHKRSIRR